MDTTQEFGHQGVAAFGDITLAEFFNGQATEQPAGISDLHPVLEDGHLHIVGISIVAVAKGVDDGLSHGL